LVGSSSTSRMRSASSTGAAGVVFDTGSLA
jgi:hypothetical protein